MHSDPVKSHTFLKFVVYINASFEWFQKGLMRGAKQFHTITEMHVDD